MHTAISLVLPAYNEAQRLPAYLPSVRNCFDTRYGESYEVIVVDDGSTDQLEHVLAPLASTWPQLALLRLATNCGKGAAVRIGVLSAEGERVLFADADGAAPIDQSDRLCAALDHGADVAIGSRLLPAGDSVRSRPLHRAVVGRMFAYAARRWLGLAVRDPQCGFKMFTRRAARDLFSRSREVGFLFDLELLLLAAERGYRVVEVPISWHEVPGGHFRPMKQLGNILRALWRLRRLARRQSAHMEEPPVPPGAQGA